MTLSASSHAFFTRSAGVRDATETIDVVAQQQQRHSTVYCICVHTRGPELEFTKNARSGHGSAGPPEPSLSWVVFIC